MMKVLYHSDAFASNSRYGLGRYSWELYEALQQTEQLELVPFASRCKVSGVELEKLLHEHNYVRPGWKHRNLVMSWALLHYPKIERWLPDADVIHTVEMDYPVPTSKPWIVTVHDLGPITHPEYFSRSRPWIRIAGIRSAINRADRIVSVSEATAEAIEGIAKKSLGDRLVVVPEGVSDYFYTESSGDCLAELDDMPVAETPFFLWTGSLNPRKNLEHVLDAFEAIADEIPQSLVLAGGLGWDSHDLLNRINASEYRSRIHRPGFVSDEQLRALYQQASAFVYVSLLEGFGLPILEAMASRCPVITSNISSMPEVAGDAGLLVNPHEADEIADAMQQIANDESVRKKLSSDGAARAKQFSWDKCADSMLDIYRTMMK